MRGVEKSLDGVSRASTGATLSTGRLGNQFANLAGRIAHTHPIVGNLASVLGDFALGGVVTAGVLGGVAAMAVIYDKLTESTRKAKEQSDKLVRGLVEQARAIQQATVAGRENLELQAELELMAAKKASGIGISSVLQSVLTGKPTLATADMDALSKRIADAQTAYEQAGKNTFEAWKQANEPIKETPKHIKKVADEVKELAFSFEQLRKNADEFWGPMNRFNEAFALPSLINPMTPGAVDISDDVKIANEQAKKINDEAAANAQAIQDAIYMSARVISDTLMSALNVGGGGKGSQIGSQLGMAAGAIGGSFLGPPGAWFGGAVGSILGSTVGGIAGSFLGGLFDHKKAVETNTAAVRQNTAALLLNAPSGYKTAGGRFDATEVKEFRRGLQRYATRGGAPILVTP